MPKPSSEFLSELFARTDAEVIRHVDAWWDVWAKYDPKAVRNGVHIERDCTVVCLPSWIYVVTENDLFKKKYVSVRWQPTGGDLTKQEARDPYSYNYNMSREQIAAAEERRARRAADKARLRAAEEKRLNDEIARRRAARNN